MSSDSAVIESNSAFSLTTLTTTNQTLAMPPTHHVETSGVRWRGEMWPKRRGNACRRAIDSPVRDAGGNVVFVETIAARPGVDVESRVSSVRLTADSQPQYANTPSSSPPDSAAPPAPNGLSQLQLGSRPPSGLS